jgi:hypothetical protein
MHFTTLVTFAAAFEAISAAALPADHSLPPLPEGLDSGIHHVNFDNDGNVMIKRVADLNTAPVFSREAGAQDDTLRKRVTTWTGCEGYAFTDSQRGDYENAWSGLLSWASADNTGVSPQVHGHYFALTDSGIYAYVCEWGNGNAATTSEINQAHGVLGPACQNGAGMFQWNDWKIGVGIAATGQKWCNGQS